MGNWAGDEFVVVTYHFNIHKFLMPFKNSFYVGNLNFKHACDRFKNAESIWNVFSEKSTFSIEDYIFTISMRESRENIFSISIVRVKYSSKWSRVFNRVFVVLDNSLFNRINAGQVYLWILLGYCFFDSLDLIIKILNLISRLLV